MRLIMTYGEDATMVKMRKVSSGNKDDGISDCEIKPPLVLKWFQ